MSITREELQEIFVEMEQTFIKLKDYSKKYSCGITMQVFEDSQTVKIEVSETDDASYNFQTILVSDGGVSYEDRKISKD